MRSNIELVRFLQLTAKASFYWASARRRSLAAVCGLFGVALLMIDRNAPSASFALPTSAMRAEQGAAFVAQVHYPVRWPLVLSNDGMSGNRSSLRLLEDGRALGPAHSAHTDIRTLGRGRYSHWGDSIWFASSDGSDPTTNGRAYRAEGQLALHPALVGLGWSLLLAGAAVLLRAALARAPGGSPGERVSGAIVALLRPSGTGTIINVGALVAGTLAGGAAVVLGWHQGTISTTGLGIARYFPVSDAFGYHGCATALAAAGQFGEPHGATWCGRRALYPAMLAALLPATGWSSQVALLLQGAWTGAAIAMFARVVCMRWGMGAALLATLCLVVYAWEFVLGLFMTEVAGFGLGLCSLALLLAYSGTGRTVVLFAGAAFLSIALTARAGALFAIPLIALWAMTRPGSAWRRTSTAAAALAGLLVGPLLQYLIVSSAGADLTSTGSNFSVSLYGLSTGSRDWTEAYRVFDAAFQKGEDVAFREIYDAGLANIRDNPAVLLKALSGAAYDYLRSLFDFGILAPVNLAISALAAAGLVLCLRRVACADCAILPVLALAEVISAPLIFDSGGTRVFAVTFPVRVLLTALGFVWLLRFAGSSAHDPTRSRGPSLGPTVRAPLLLGLPVVAAIVLIATPVATLMRLDPVAAPGSCPPGTSSVVARVGRESQTITVAAPGEAQTLLPFSISASKLANDERLRFSWFGADVLSLPPGTTLVHAVELAPGRVGAVRPLFLDRDRFDADARPSLLCLHSSEAREVAGVRYQRVIERRRDD